MDKDLKLDEIRRMLSSESLKQQGLIQLANNITYYLQISDLVEKCIPRGPDLSEADVALMKGIAKVLSTAVKAEIALRETSAEKFLHSFICYVAERAYENFRVDGNEQVIAAEDYIDEFKVLQSVFPNLGERIRDVYFSKILGGISYSLAGFQGFAELFDELKCPQPEELKKSRNTLEDVYSKLERMRKP